ncbi:MAG: hydroxymethylbilane synthase [Desulfobulbus propionicus]|nr:MAG: hydroxymethylbilane synthase [Desulfobulbus propionicus]
MRSLIRIGTRGSLLAVTQSTWIKNKIEAQYPAARVELVKITTRGDKILDVPLAKVGGKGLFVKEIEEALLGGKIDLAVHSMKDVPAELPARLHIAVIPEREESADAFVSTRYASFESLPQGAVIGTSSLRRKAQLSALRPDLNITDLRGNLDTRLNKLEQGIYDAIILAGAGLNRLGMQKRIAALFTPEQMLPAVGQGALGLELRTDDAELLEGLSFMHHQETAKTVAAERAFLLRLEGGCQVPIGAHAVASKDKITVTGLVAEIDGSTILRESLTDLAVNADAMGKKLADILLEKGGRAILEKIYNSN